MKIIIATKKTWNIENAKKLILEYSNCHEISIIESEDGLFYDAVRDNNPDYIFFPHWSTMIPKEIYEKYRCVVFHMTDLPFGRGGSPLQNLIVRGYTETKISAIKVVEELDAGPVYFKEPLSLEGSAQDIYIRASDIIFNNMIPRFFDEEIIPSPQTGEVTVFKRRLPEDSRLEKHMSMDKVYDHIRMLDAEGYPAANIEMGSYKIEFREAEKKDDTIIARAVFRRKCNE